MPRSRCVTGVIDQRHAACGGDAEQDSAAGKGEPIKIGVNLEMSGPASVLGQAFVNATKLRARTLNEQEGGIMGRRIELVVRDNRSDQTEALTLSPADEKPNVFKTTPDGDIVAATIATDLDDRGIKRVALLSTNNPYGDDGLQAMKSLADQGRFKLVAAEKFEDDAASRSRPATPWRSSAPMARARRPC
jgi:branched-chain amino acid transport system substrate-binding protein